MGLLFEIAVLVLAHLLVVAVAGLGFANLLLVAMAELDAMHHLQILLLGSYCLPEHDAHLSKLDFQ